MSKHRVFCPNFLILQGLALAMEKRPSDVPMEFVWVCGLSVTGGIIVAMPVTKKAPPSAKVSFLQFRSTALPFHFSFFHRKTPGSYIFQEV